MKDLRAVGPTNIVAPGFSPVDSKNVNTSAVGTTHIIWAEPTALYLFVSIVIFGTPE
ncbi:hypothetical protein [Mucilaginibacter sp. UYCu711]|uniref:hypothetical protein n=1 Tax=Mucilaginibacter sp. UYCu711 TaxID=3156339 RepID=UPI003D1E61DA